MQRHIANFTVHKWATTFVNALADTPAGLDQVSTAKTFSKADREKLLQAYGNATKRLLLLDYDGTLAPFAGNPEEAAPLTQLKQLLTQLTASAKNDVVIVSGRSKDKIAQWFDTIPLSLAVEHGALYRPAGSTHWQQIKDVGTSWKKIIRPILEDYANKTPGASVEEKEWSIVWHYREAHPYYAHKNLVILRRLFRSLPKSSGLILQNGNMILEIRPRAINKGLIVKHCLTPQHDFVLILGDDLTDEDMFAAAPAKAFTVKVGRGRTHATYRLPSITAANELLEKLT
jgi:trehalose 6-phosphate synthase/phosphatase